MAKYADTALNTIRQTSQSLYFGCCILAFCGMYWGNSYQHYTFDFEYLYFYEIFQYTLDFCS